VLLVRIYQMNICILLRWLRLLFFYTGALLCAPGALAQKPPPWFPLPPGIIVAGVLEEEYGEAEIRLPDRATPNILRGRHWSGDMDITKLGAKPDASGREVYARLRPTLEKAGWEVVHSSDEGTTLRNRKDGRDAWARISGGDAADVRWVIIDVAAQTRRHVLTPPGPKPEALKDGAPIPYLAPLPEFTLVGSGYEAVPLMAVLEGSTQPQVLAQGVHVRHYGGPQKHVSALQFAAVYEAALKAAGWQIVQIERGGIGAQGSSILARYTRNGRDVWARLGGGGDSFTFTVADAGADDLAARLRKDCRAPLHGLFFDFDKATLRPASDAVLARALEALKATAPQAYEVQGHTDNVGNDAYNQKLSEARANTVTAWLAGQGIAAPRLAARGYGRTQPVASNTTDEGRARNRRVELVCRK
jgi:hypothetical protein